MLENLAEEVKDVEFWENYKKYSPIRMCYASDPQPKVSFKRDEVVTGEILKTLCLLGILAKKLEDQPPGSIDVFEFTHALSVIKDKIEIMEALKSPPPNPKFVRMRVKGTNKVLKVDLKKFHEAISFRNTDGTPDPEPEEKKEETLSEEDEQHLERLLRNFDLELTDQNTISKKSMMGMLKLISEFAKHRSRDLTDNSQRERLPHFDQDADKYIECVAGQMSKEEDNYNKCTAEVLTRLKITREQFIKTEQTLMMDPLAQMEMLEKGMESDNEYEGIEIPSDLTRERVIEIIKDSNDKGFEKFKAMLQQVQAKDPMLVPIVISCLRS